MERERQVLALALAIMVGMCLVVGGSMWLGATLVDTRCTARTALLALALDRVEQERDSLQTQLGVLVCVTPGSPPSLSRC